MHPWHRRSHEDAVGVGVPPRARSEKIGFNLQGQLVTEPSPTEQFTNYNFLDLAPPQAHSGQTLHLYNFRSFPEKTTPDPMATRPQGRPSSTPTRVVQTICLLGAPVQAVPKHFPKFTPTRYDVCDAGTGTL